MCMILVYVCVRVQQELLFINIIIFIFCVYARMYLHVRVRVRVRTIAGKAHTVRNRQIAANREISSLPFTLSSRWNPEGRSLLITV